MQLKEKIQAKGGVEVEKASLVSAQVGAVGWGTKADGGDGAQLGRAEHRPINAENAPGWCENQPVGARPTMTAVCGCEL